MESNHNYYGWIPDPVSWIPDSTDQNYLDSGLPYMGQLFNQSHLLMGKKCTSKVAIFAKIDLNPSEC